MKPENPQKPLHARIDEDFGFHPGTAETIPRHDEVRRLYKELAHKVIDLTPVCRDQSLALTELEHSARSANAAIAKAAPLAP